jgi:hypothetical protein
MMEMIDVSRLNLSAASSAQGIAGASYSRRSAKMTAGRTLSARTRRSRCRSVEKTALLRSASFAGQAPFWRAGARAAASERADQMIQRPAPLRLFCRHGAGSRAGVPARRAHINRDLLVTDRARRFFFFLQRVWKSELVISYDRETGRNRIFWRRKWK